MPYRFNITETVPGNVRRIAAEEIKSAISHLRGKDPERREEDIHEARKSIKRLRALLRLVRPGLGRCFRQENTALRDIGRSLSELRDASIVLSTFDALSDADSERKTLQPARAALQQQKKTKEKTTDTEQTLRAAAEALQAVAERVSAWALESDGFDAIADGLRAEYRGGRKAMPKALNKNDSLFFHEWRKRAKCQLYHLRLLKNFLTDQLRQQEKHLHDLESALGDDHNLLILRQHLDVQPGAFGGKKVVHRSLRLVGQRETSLRSEAEALGEKIYAAKPKEFIAELRTEWERAASRGTEPRRPKRSAA